MVVTSQISKLKALTAVDDYGWNDPAPEISDKEVWKSLVGREVGRESFLNGQIRARQLKDQSNAIVERLERCGLQGRSARGGVTVVGMVSGKAELATDFRNCNLIPVQQSRNVHDMLKHVRYLMDQTPKKNRLRMLVVSGGWCQFDEYRKHHTAHTRRMSKFAAHKRLKEFGIQVEFYNVENTIHRDDGKAMLNLHSHALFRSTRYLGKQKWNEFLDFARNFFPKGYVHDSKIEKPEEVVKYVFKPSEFDLMSDPEFTEFAQQVIGGRPKVDPETGEIVTRENDTGEIVEVREGPLKFFHPLGTMRKFRSELNKGRQKLILVPTSDDRWIWRKTEKKKPQPQPEMNSAPTENMVLAITRPMPKFMQRMEPCLIIQDYAGNFDQMVRQAGLFELVSDARRLFADRERLDAKALRESENAAQGKALSMKHTTTTTVPVTRSFEVANYPPPTSDPPGQLPEGRLH